MLELGDTRVVIDMGNGSTANLQRLCGFDDIDAVIITHRHIDHYVDLVSSFYGLRERYLERGHRIPVHAAPEVAYAAKALLSRDSTLLFDEVYDTNEIVAGDQVDVGPLHFEFLHSIHPAPTLSVRCTWDGRTFVYSSDSAGGKPLLQAARGADTFLCEATWDQLDGFPEGIHLDGTLAGQAARDAEVGRLLLTHVSPEANRTRIAADAGAAFPGEVVLVDDLDTFDL